MGACMSKNDSGRKPRNVHIFKCEFKSGRIPEEFVAQTASHYPFVEYAEGCSLHENKAMYLQGRGQNRRRSYAGPRNQSGRIAQNNGVCFNCGGFGHWQRVYYYQSKAGKCCFARGGSE
ncbi:hypothetical protein FKM82_026109 [Ascaphus truei]